MSKYPIEVNLPKYLSAALICCIYCSDLVYWL